MKLILSTSNIMNDGGGVVQARNESSSVELVNSLRANILQAQSAAVTATCANADNRGRAPAPLDPSTWTSRQGDVLFVPASGRESSSPDRSTQSCLAEPRAEYAITAKLFFLPGWNQDESTTDKAIELAVQLVLGELAVSKLDLVIASFTGISFGAEDDGSEPETETDGAAGSAKRLPLEHSVARCWAAFERLHQDSKLDRLGVAEFGTSRLSRLLTILSSRPALDRTERRTSDGETSNGACHTSVMPKVNQLNIRDCCVVPKKLILFAKEHGIELLAHNDCTNIMKSGTLRALLGGKSTPPPPSPDKPETEDSKTASDSCASQTCTRLIPLLTDFASDKPTSSSTTTNRLAGEVTPRLVVKYTAVLTNQGVVENKGYFVIADLDDCS